MKFNYSKLLGKIRECGFTQEQLAKAIGISKTTFSAKVNNQFHFTSKEIYAVCEILDIPKDEIGEFFYTV